MSFDGILAALALPREALVDRRVPKKMLAEQGAPTAADKRRLLEGMEELMWVAALKPVNVGIPAFTDQVREYLEIAVLTAVLRSGPRASQARTLELIHRAIPYPVVLFSSQSGVVTLSLAHKRWSQGERGRVVLEELRSVQLRPDALPPTEVSFDAQFLANLAISRAPAANLYALYDGWLRHILALEAARVTGRYAPPSTAEAAARLRQSLEELGRQQRQLAALRTQARKEKQINRRVELNLEIQRITTAIDDCRQSLAKEEQD